MNRHLQRRLGLVAMVLLGMYAVLGAYFAYGQLFYGNRWFARSSNPPLSISSQRTPLWSRGTSWIGTGKNWPTR